MPIRWGTREYERTCQDCGNAWRVPSWAAHPHMQGLPISFGGGRAGSGMPGGGVSGGGGGGVSGGGGGAVGAGVAGDAAAVAEANAELAEKVAAFRACPKCDSEHYKQRPVRS
jgi:hypothetical protein